MKYLYLLAQTSALVLITNVLFTVSSAQASPPSITTQMYNNQHTGWNNQETKLTIANVKTNFKLLFTDTADGQSYSQPLYVPGLKMGRLGKHNVIFVATESNNVYAFDADHARKPLWKVNLTPAGETLQVGADYENSRIPEMGISGTPVIDPATGTLYAVAASKTTAGQAIFHQRLHALDITTGKERPNSPVDVVAKFPGSGQEQDGNGNVVFDPLVQFDRSALTLFENNVYIAWSAHEDNGSLKAQSLNAYQGWITAYDKTSLAQVAVFNDSPNLPALVGGGSIWQAAVGMVADDPSTPNASIYALTANGPFDPNSGNYGDTALRLTPGLTVGDFFTPCNQLELDDLDVDLGSGAAMILPDQNSSPTRLLTFAGKEGSIYLVDRTAMGGYTPTTVADNVPCTDNVVQKLWRVVGVTDSTGDSNRDAFWGAPAYFSDSSGRQYIYYAGDYAPITEFDLSNGTLTAGLNDSGKPNQTPGSEYNFAHGGTIPAVSSNGGDPSSAIVWAVRHPLPPGDGIGQITLDAFAATDLSQQIVNDIPAGTWNYHNDSFLIPTIANGKVYVFSGGELDVFGVSSAKPGGPPSIRLNRNAVNFGTVSANSTTTQTFTIKNVGKGDLHVTLGAQGAFQVLQPNALNLNIFKGQTSTVMVQFAPSASGNFSDTMTIVSDDPKNPSLRVSLAGTGQ